MRCSFVILLLYHMQRYLARKDFGTRYIVFPNPAYGAWLSALSKEYMTMTPVERLAFYDDVLTKGISAETKRNYEKEKM